jgi:hypothetical protein
MTNLVIRPRVMNSCENVATALDIATPSGQVIILTVSVLALAVVPCECAGDINCWC